MNLEPLKNWLGVELSAVSAMEKLVSGAGGLASILFALFLGHWLLPPGPAAGLVASMGASAVLLFAVPHGQLSQPWPVVAGHGFSALIGVACARWMPSPMWAAACAVGLSIMAMHQLKCIHPPGGATALTAVLGGDELHGLGFGYVLFPVLFNAVAMVGLAVAINACFPWRRYPAFANHPPPPETASDDLPATPSHEEIVAALRSLDSFVDITEDDLVRLVQLLGTPREGSRSNGARRREPEQ